MSSCYRSLTAKLFSKPTAPTRTELLYLPYHRFTIELSDSESNEPVSVAVDGLVGEIVFFVKPETAHAPPGDFQCCKFELSAAEARSVVLDEYRRMLLQHCLRNKSTTTVQCVSSAVPVLYPFWIGYFRKGEAYDFSALDAVSGSVQGVRMRKVFLRAFRQLERG